LLTDKQSSQPGENIFDLPGGDNHFISSYRGWQT